MSLASIAATAYLLAGALVFLRLEGAVNEEFARHVEPWIGPGFRRFLYGTTMLLVVLAWPLLVAARIVDDASSP